MLATLKNEGNTIGGRHCRNSEESTVRTVMG